MIRKSENQRRRQAAWATLEPHLSEQDLAAAITLLDSHYQESSMASLIRYINEVGDLTGKLDQRTRKSLYPKYYQLLNDQNSTLPEDPLPLQKETKAQLFRKKLASPLSEMIATVKSLSSSAISAIPDSLSKPAEFHIADNSDKNFPETIVFDYLMQRLLIRFPADITLFTSTLNTNIAQDEFLSSQAKDELSTWIDNSDHRWSPDLNESTLSELVQLIYQNLCDSIGRAQADQLFLELFSDCDEIPEASQFPPTLFL